MIYYDDKEMLIRDMVQSDADIITEEEIAQGWHQSIEKYKSRLKDQSEGKAIALVAEYKGCVAGYVNVYPNPKSGPFVNQGYPEIVDFGVLAKYRRKGIGSKLMDVAEMVAIKYSDIVTIAVGLHEGYGSAQRMYVKRGYIPDGSGLWYGEKVCPIFSNCCNDDDMILYFSKKLR